MKPEDIKQLQDKKPDELLYLHDLKLYELSARLDSLENLLNKMMQKQPPYWV